ncbi:hypothetical protein ACOSQ2_029934 [Xanthoceras sorbifolium]
MDPDELSRYCSRLSLSEEDGPVAVIGADLQDLGRRKLSLSLIGKIVGNRDVNRDAFRVTISSIWRTTKGLEIEAMGNNLFVFRFNCMLDRKRVLEGGPWTFDKQLLVLKEASGVGRVTEVDFSWSHFWIQLHNLPLVCMGKEVGLYLGGKIGKVLEVDTGDGGDCAGKFIRLRVLLEVDKPLKRGLRVALGEGEELTSVLSCYERLPNFCYYCGKIGHMVRECPVKVGGLVDISGDKFGPWMKAPIPFRTRGFGGRRGDFNQLENAKDKEKNVNGVQVDREKDSSSSRSANVEEAEREDKLVGTVDVDDGKENVVPMPEEEVVGAVTRSRQKRWKRRAREKGDIHIADSDVAVRKRDSSKKWGSRFFFEQSWADDSDCKSIVKKAWQSGFSLGAVAEVQNKVGAVSSRLRDWNILKRKAEDRELRGLRCELEDLFKCNQGGSVYAKMMEVEQKIDKILEKNEVFWRQRSRALWLKEGDKNTRYFHNKATQRRKKNRILGLMDKGGFWKEKSEDVKFIVTDFFQQLIRSKNPSAEDLKARYITPYSRNESLGRYMAPNPQDES